MAGASGDELTAEQRAVYDRQLRVWGVEAQRRLGQATFFVAGLTGLSAEACKNVVLAGIGSVVLFDDGTSAEDAHPGNFLAHAGVADHEGDAASLTAAEATAATLAQMNPFGTVTVARGDASDASASEGPEATVGIELLKGVAWCSGGASVAARERVGTSRAPPAEDLRRRRPRVRRLRRDLGEVRHSSRRRLRAHEDHHENRDVRHLAR